MQRPLTVARLLANRSKQNRKLEIGPGSSRMPGFETLGLGHGWHIDYYYDASGRLPFADGVFDLLYASHVLEHIPWYGTEKTLAEWVRIIRPGGWLEVWVPNALKICQSMIAAEMEGEGSCPDGWIFRNPDRDPCVWANGHLYYGGRNGIENQASWHRALFTPQYLVRLFERAGLHEVRLLRPGEVRGIDHSWINLGVTGRKQ